MPLYCYITVLCYGTLFLFGIHYFGSFVSLLNDYSCLHLDQFFENFFSFGT